MYETLQSNLENLSKFIVTTKGSINVCLCEFTSAFQA